MTEGREKAARVAALLEGGVARHRAGDLDAAEAAYRAVLSDAPGNADAHHLLGVIAGQRGRNAEGVARVAEAVRLDPADPNFHVSLGHLLLASGRREEGAASYARAAVIAPDVPEIRACLGRILVDLGRHDEALPHLREVVRLSPASPPAYADLGNALLLAGHFEEAEGYHRLALEFFPGSPEAHYNLATARLHLGRAEEAEAGFRKALAVRPDYVEALCNLGLVLQAQGRREEAGEAVRQALAVRPDAAVLHYNLGLILQELGRLDEADASYREAIARDPGHVEARVNLGLTLKLRARPAEAATQYEEALRLRPDYAEAEWNLALALLLQGEYARGFERYESRWRVPDITTPRRDFGRPAWRGEPLDGRRILLHAEQGIGDTIQFVRYAPLVAARGGRVVLEANPELAGLLRGFPGVGTLVARGSHLPPFDLHCPLMSLPRVFGTTVDSVPAADAYLSADPGDAESWDQRLGPRDGRLRVGLRWAGRKGFKGDRTRSTTLASFAKLGECRHVDFISLQRDEGADEVLSPPAGMAIRDFRADLRDMADTAALVAGLDLVITTCTSIAHLSAALGRPTWILLQFVPDWRWMLGRGDSPWYPTARLFRQKAAGDWEGVMEEVARALAGYRTGRA